METVSLKMDCNITIAPTDLTSPVSRALIAALNEELSGVYSEPGATHFRLDASATFCESIGDTPDRQSWSHAAVAYFCLHHATELFLKACILSRSSSEKLHHDVSQLKSRYRELFPGADCDFHSPWSISADDLDCLLQSRVLEGIDRVPDQKYRYASGKDLKPSQSISSFAPGYIFNYTNYLRVRCRLIWDRTKVQTKS